MKAAIALLPGDGVGPEVTAEAVRVLSLVAEHRGDQPQQDDVTATLIEFGMPPSD